MRDMRNSVGLLLFFLVVLLATSAHAGKKIKLGDYWFPGGDGSFWTYEYQKAPPGQLNFPGAPEFTVNMTLGNYGPYTGIYRLGDYYFPDYYDGSQTLYVSLGKKDLYFYGNKDGFFAEPKVIPGSQPLEQVIEHPGDSNCPWYFKMQSSITVPAGTFTNVLVKIDLDRRFGGPNLADYLVGVAVPGAGVTHVTWYARGVGEVANMDADENGELLFFYVLKNYGVK